MTRNEAQVAAWKTVDLATKVLVPVLVAACVGLWTQVQDNRDRGSRNDERIKAIESSRFTNRDAAKLLEQVRIIVRDEVEHVVKPVEDKLGDVKVRLERLETRVK